MATSKRYGRIGLIFVLLEMAGTAPGQPEGTEEYFAVFCNGRKSGHGVHTRRVDGGDVVTTDQIRLSIQRNGTPMEIEVLETCIESPEGDILGFEGRQTFSILAMEVTGRRNAAGNLDAEIRTGDLVQKREIVLPPGTLMAEGIRLLMEKNKPLQAGKVMDITLFTPTLLQAVEAQIRVGERKTVDLIGRVSELTEVTVSLKPPGAASGGEDPAFQQMVYVDEAFEAKKMIQTVANITLELISCSKVFAMRENEPSEFVDQMILASPAPMESVQRISSIRYHIKPLNKGKPLVFVEDDNQTVQPDGEGGVYVTVKPASASAGIVYPYSGSDPKLRQALQSTRYLQSEHELIGQLARKAAGDAPDALEAAKRIESFVHDYIQTRDLSVGYASALEVARSRQGDCTEHAVLTAALCRASGIPARVVTGYIYADEFAGRRQVFVGHAWAQANIGGKWIGLDATRAPKGYGADHLALSASDGSPEDFWSTVADLQQFAIREVQIGPMEPAGNL